MVRSMTGYGRSQEIIDGRDITVEIRSVNHRFFEFSSRTPRAYGYLDEKLKSTVQGQVSRGKVDVSVTLVTVDGLNTKVQINHELAAEYLRALRAMGTELQLQDDVTLTTLTRFSDIFIIGKTAEDEGTTWQAVKQVTNQALTGFIQMREREGDRMKVDVLQRLDLIEQYVQQVEMLAPKTVDSYRNRLYAKLKDVLQDTTIEDQRILTEAAIFAERVAVAEETVRLYSHIRQCKEILACGEPVGRKLDFLVQEFNREANTIGSKAQDVAVAQIVIEIKSEIEKIREQIQNIE